MLIGGLPRAVWRFELSSEPEPPWLSKSEVRAAIRSQQAADELVATVRQSRRASTFVVASSQPGHSHEVEAELRVPPGTEPADIVRNCECLAHVKRGPICKHAGAVLLTLAAEQ
eukprot:9173515-Alexandrium_andersonii.AAC.1